jgi:hypothetical protein
MRLQTSERVDIADGPVDSRSKVSPPIARLVSENPLREPWIFVEGEDHTKDTTVRSKGMGQVEERRPGILRRPLRTLRGGPGNVTHPNKRGGYRDTVKLPRESERKSLVDLNPELFPPMRSTMGSVDLAMLDEFGSKKPYK